MSNAQATEEQVVQAVYEFAARQMRAGASRDKIQSMLMDQGLDQESAAAVVNNLTRMRDEAIRSAGTKNIFFGALWCVGGIVVTAVTYNAAASAGGGTYVVAWGAVVFGAIQVMRGLLQLAG